MDDGGTSITTYLSKSTNRETDQVILMHWCGDAIVAKAHSGGDIDSREASEGGCMQLLSARMTLVAHKPPL